MPISVNFSYLGRQRAWKGTISGCHEEEDKEKITNKHHQQSKTDSAAPEHNSSQKHSTTGLRTGEMGTRINNSTQQASEPRSQKGTPATKHATKRQQQTRRPSNQHPETTDSSRGHHPTQTRQPSTTQQEAMQQTAQRTTGGTIRAKTSQTVQKRENRGSMKSNESKETPQQKHCRTLALPEDLSRCAKNPSALTSSDSVILGANCPPRLALHYHQRRKEPTDYTT